MTTRRIDVRRGLSVQITPQERHTDCSRVRCHWHDWRANRSSLARGRRYHESWLMHHRAYVARRRRSHFLLPGRSADLHQNWPVGDNPSLFCDCADCEHKMRVPKRAGVSTVLVVPTLRSSHLSSFALVLTELLHNLSVLMCCGVVSLRISQSHSFVVTSMTS